MQVTALGLSGLLAAVVYCQGMGSGMVPEPLTWFDCSCGPRCLLQFAGEDDSGERCQFYHTPRTRDLDERLGDIFHKISGAESNTV